MSLTPAALLIFPLTMRAKAHCAQTALRRRHWPASFLWSSPANAGYAARRIDTCNTSGLCLSAPLRRKRGPQVVGNELTGIHFALQRE